MQLARLLKARPHLRQQHVAVRAVRPQRERLASEHSTSRPGGLPRLVDQILGAVPRYGSVPLGAPRDRDRDRGEIVLHPNTNTAPAGRRRSQLGPWPLTPVFRTKLLAAPPRLDWHEPSATRASCGARRPDGVE